MKIVANPTSQTGVSNKSTSKDERNGILVAVFVLLPLPEGPCNERVPESPVGSDWLHLIWKMAEMAEMAKEAGYKSQQLGIKC